MRFRCGTLLPAPLCFAFGLPFATGLRRLRIGLLVVCVRLRPVPRWIQSALHYFVISDDADELQEVVVLLHPMLEDGEGLWVGVSGGLAKVNTVWEYGCWGVEEFKAAILNLLPRCCCRPSTTCAC